MSRPAQNFKKAFGEALEAQLHARQMTQSDLAARTGKSVSYLNRTMSASRSISPEWVDLIADTLSLSETEARQLHTSAALDMGYKLDLSRPTNLAAQKEARSPRASAAGPKLRHKNRAGETR